MLNVTDNILMEQTINLAKNGDTKAIQALIETHQTEVYAFLLRRLGQPVHAQDATQVTMIKVVRGIAGYVEKGTFKAWMYRIARNVANDHLRKLQNRGGVAEELTETMSDDSVDVASEVERKERFQIAMKLLDRLPELEREVMMLRALDGYKFREIAELVMSPLNTVLGRMRNATLKMQQWMKEIES